MIDDDDDEEAVVSFESFFSGTELDFFTDCAKGSGTRFSCNEFDTLLFIIFLPRRAMMARGNRFMPAFLSIRMMWREKKSVQHEYMVSVSKMSEFMVLCEENNFSRLLLLLWRRAKKETLFRVYFQPIRIIFFLALNQRLSLF